MQMNYLMIVLIEVSATLRLVRKLYKFPTKTTLLK